MSNYESYDLLRSNQQLEEYETTSACAGTRKSSQKSKSKTKRNKKGSRTIKPTKKTKEAEETEPTLQNLTSGNSERNALRETTNEQVQDNGSENVVPNNMEPNNTNNTEQEN